MKYILPQDLKSFGLIPEIIGRLPVLTYLNPLDRNALRAILTEPKNNEKLLIFIDRASRYLQNVKKRLYSDGNQQSQC